MASKSGRRSSPVRPDRRLRRADPRVRVQDREIELLFVGVEIDEQIVDLVQDFLRRARPAGRSC